MHPRRFALLYLALIAAVGGGVAGLVLALNASSTSPLNQGWSAWHPVSDGPPKVQQIVKHIAPSYRLATGKQIVDVFAQPPAVQNIPIKGLAVQGKKTFDEVHNLDRSNSLMFVLCGGGPACSIKTGKPSVERGRFIRREVLELALYTFHYMPQVSHVLAFMPPRDANSATTRYLVYLDRDRLHDQLSKPLRDTLSSKVPRHYTLPEREIKTVERLTSSRTFSFQIEQAQQGDAVIILSRAA